MKRPSFQFYPADWRGNGKLRRCSEAARGAWVDIMCVLHDSDEYGVCRWALAELARSAGVPLKLAKELSEKDVLKGADSGASDFIHIPFHAGKHGEPVTLVKVGTGPCWYCSRFVRDEWLRTRRGIGTRFDSTNQPNSRSPNRRQGERQGDGATSSSSSSSSVQANQHYRGPAFPSLDEVKAHAQFIGMAEADAEKFWLHFEASGWIDKNKNPIVNWKAKQQIWKTDNAAAPFERNHHAQPKEISPSVVATQAGREYERCIEKIRKIRDGAATASMGDKFFTPAEKAELARLCARRDELKKQLGVVV